ncbi:sugar transferase [Candidatus Saccharibacteria bacterium]|nr:sugar transferase [Candidatus Saccharibacteria bacterium]
MDPYSWSRFVRRILFSYGIGITNLVVVGSGKSTEKIVEQFVDTNSTGYRIIGSVGEKSIVSEIPFFESIEKLNHNLKLQIHSILQTKLYKDDEKNSDILNYAQANHIEYRFIPGNSELYSGNIEVELFREVPVVTVHQTALNGWGQVVKRLFDIVLGGFLLVLLSPVILLVSLLQKITEPRGDIFLRQKRLTQFNRSFVVFKFRSHKTKYNGMSPEEAFKVMGKPELAKEYRRNGDFLPNDPRISRLGKFLRVTSLDELPQLFNVVRGDISLVGPRALIPEELEQYHEKHHILSVKSGMTGLAQVSGRRNLSFEERRKLDVYYVQNWSFWLDIVIMLRTLRAVIGGSGAK